MTTLDKALIAYRADPSEANKARLMAAQRAYGSTFMQSQTRDYMARTYARRAK